MLIHFGKGDTDPVLQSGFLRLEAHGWIQFEEMYFQDLMKAAAFGPAKLELGMSSWRSFDLLVWSTTSNVANMALSPVFSRSERLRCCRRFDFPDGSIS